MVRSIAAVRAALSAPATCNADVSRFRIAEVQRMVRQYQSDRFAPRRCRSVREQQRHEAIRRDEMPFGC